MTQDAYPDSSPTKEKAQAAASTAADEGKRVAGVAQGEAQKVASEATTQVRNVLGDAQTQIGDQLGEQTRTQRDNLVGTLGSLTDELHQMADGSEHPGLAADLARQVAGHTKTAADYLDGREPGQMLEDARDFARRRPGTFLLGALAAGLVAGRLARGAKAAGSTGSTPSVTSDAPALDIAPGTTRNPTTYDATSPVPTTPATTTPATPGFTDPTDPLASDWQSGSGGFGDQTAVPGAL